MEKDLQKIPESLKVALKKGKVIPFVGSGISRAVERKKFDGVASINSLFPSWRDYIEILATALDDRDKSAAASYVRDCLNANPPDYLGAMQVAFDKLGETDWDRLIDRHFDFEVNDADDQSLELARLIWRISENLIITTNIDRVLQWTCPNPKEFKILESQKKEFGKLNKENPPKYPTVVYFHGHIDNKANIIFTKEQYKSFYDYKNNEAKLETLKTLLAQSTFLFIGFSLDDPYFLQQLRYFHKLYEGGADSFFVLIHKNEKDNLNIPEFVRKIVFEDYGQPLLDLLRQLANIAQEEDIEAPKIQSLALGNSPKPIGAISNSSRDVDKKLREEINKSNVERTNVGIDQSGRINSEADRTRKSTTFRTTFQKYWIIIAATALLLVIGFSWRNFISKPSIDSMPIDSIAVLPFQNGSLDPNTDYLSDGLTQSLIYRLSQLHDLKVSPTSSVFRYKGKETDPVKVGSDLGVRAVMTGRIVQRGDRLFISVELVDIRNNSLIWGEQYDRKMSELLATQREIAAEITQKLQLKLSGKDQEGLTKPYTNNNEAYQLFLKGRYHYAKRTKDDMLKGIGYFEQATELDKNFALAHATLADAYATMPGYSYLSPKEAFPKAKAAAQRALGIDPTLAEAHTAWASCLAVYDWNWVEAEIEFKLAIELNPNPFVTHFRYGLLYLMPIGRSDDAIFELRQSLLAEPLSLVSGSNLAAAYIFAGKNKQALSQAKETNDLEPNFVSGRYYLGLAYIANGMYKEAIELSEKSLQADPTNQLLLRVAGIAYAKNKQRHEAEGIINKFRDIGKTKQYVMSYLVANIYTALGDKDKAFNELKKSFSERDWDLHRLKVDPFLAPLRDDPRFKEMVKRLNLPE
jgi:TolB-like protein/Tfp pilus assembly protein PilF